MWRSTVLSLTLWLAFPGIDNAKPFRICRTNKKNSFLPLIRTKVYKCVV